MAAKRLLPLHRGVYAVGHRRLRREGFWLAAVLAAGPGGAAEPPRGGGAARAAAGGPGDRGRDGGGPPPAVARMLVDLAAVVPPQALRRALEEAERSHRLDVKAIEAVLQRTRGRNGPGHARIARALAELASTGATMTRSALEDRFLALVAEHGLPTPHTNASIDGVEVDAVWHDRRLVVELDGWAYHRTRDAFQRDRDRANDLTANGWTVLRFTHDDVIRRPRRTLKRIAQAGTATD